VRAVAAGCVLLTGCFFVDPIVPRPRVNIAVVPPSVIQRDGVVTLAANFVDGGSDRGRYDWNVFSCLTFDQAAAGGCDKIAFRTVSDTADNTVSFTVPVMTMSGAGKTQAIKVELEARSDRGALALQEDNSDFAVNDAPPAVQLTMRSHSLAVGAPIDLFATYSDPDDALDDVAVAWAPTGPAPYMLEDLEVPQDPTDPAHRGAGKRLTPSATGNWDMQVTATDREGASTIQHLSFAVVADRPPCLQQWLPIVPPADATLPISAPTVFQVPLVDDDLDAYPPIPGATQYGTTAFAWSILPPGAAQRQTLVGATGNAVELDPAAFTPGDVVELRVEIFDRHHTALPCDDAAATCSITSSDTCIQRQTWRVEAR
jgi:hypothetical protein